MLKYSLIFKIKILHALYVNLSLNMNKDDSEIKKNIYHKNKKISFI